MPQISQPRLGVILWHKVHLVQHEDEFLPFALSTSDFFLDKATPAAFRVSSIQNQEDNVAFVDDPMENSNVVSLCLLFGFLPNVCG